MSRSVAHLPHPAEASLFGDALTCDAVLPASFQRGARVLMQQASETLLLGLAVAEDTRGEDPDERGELPLAVQRLDAKLDLVLGLLGRLAGRLENPLPPCPLRWSHRGLRLDLEQPVDVATGDTGVVRLAPVSWINDSIELPVTVLDQQHSESGQHLWLRTGALEPGYAEALERHLFRMHRRQIAEARRASGG
ncbi:PilZ domain-containing protein [Pseudoxanthomonas dokdonensis]|uniref:Cyclic di-GMP receptor atypical PilZ domain-containing protein n=1 Tax=Pseudoxanthomonas dokdonensis TaxID=344882 RepID=A0A0R0CZ69_9GAMM|nr:PilZ domain-containing protein [Pseudoxanthomonas dokdonensis]KRG71076.1 hypothetical protein ABB29_04460 [Pseudoxanthomonas dokdonensis]